MMILFANVFAAASFAYGSEDMPLLLLQKSATKVAALPEVSHVLRQPQQALAALTSQLGAFENKIASVQKENNEEIRKRRGQYVEQLEAVASETEALRAANLKLSHQIEDVRGRNKLFREKSAKLSEQTKSLLEDMRRIQANITLAQEFIANSMDMGKVGLNASAISVLSELDEKDAAVEMDMAHSRKLMEIQKLPEVVGKTSLLQLAASSRTAEHPRNLLASLLVSLEELSRARNSSLLFMKEKFDAELANRMQQRAALINEREQLNATLAREEDTEQKLVRAVSHLESTYNELLKRSMSLREFARRLGQFPLPGQRVYEEKTSLLQFSRRALKRDDLLPNVSKVLKPSNKVMKELNSKFTSFEAHLAAEQASGTQRVVQQRAEFIQKLKEQVAKNKKLEDENQVISKEIDALHQHNTDLRAQVEKVSNENEALATDVDQIQAKLSTVQDLANKGMMDAQAANNVPQMQVLLDLEKQEVTNNKALARAARGDDIGRQAMIQVSSEPPEELMVSLLESLDALRREQSKSEATLSEKFDKALKLRVDQHKALEATQAKLIATRASEQTLQGKLQSALAHEMQVKETFVKRSKALRQFAQRLGASAIPHSASVSLLQVASESEKSLPGVAEVLKAPTTVLRHLGSHVQELEARLAEINQQAHDAIAAQKAEYEAQLRKQKEANRETKAKNHDLVTKIHLLNDENKQLRKEAVVLEQASKGLKGDLQKFQFNMTTVQEFTASTLADSEKMLKQSEQLKVLDELHQLDTATSEKLDHKHRLEQVGGSFSLLQFENAVAGKFDISPPTELLEELMTSLQDLSKEQAASGVALNESFTTELQKLLDINSTLYKEQEQLNGTLSAASALNHKLKVAVKHLKKTHQELLDRTKSLRAFASSLGAREMPNDDLPASLLQIAKETATSNMEMSTSPSVSDVIKRPKQVYRGLSSTLTMLEADVSKLHRKEVERVQEIRAEYEKQVSNAIAKNEDMQMQNEGISNSINDMHAASVELRKKAGALQKDIDALTTDVKQVQGNISLATEFATQALETHQSAQKANELQILESLAREEDAAALIAAHQAHLKSIGSFIQVETNPDPRQLLQTLMQQFDSLAEEQNHSQVALQAKYEAILAEKANMYGQLQQEQERLNATLDKETALNGRLQKAVRHLQDTKEQLSSRAMALRVFAQRLGVSPMPIVVERDAATNAAAHQVAANTSTAQQGQSTRKNRNRAARVGGLAGQNDTTSRQR